MLDVRRKSSEFVTMMARRHNSRSQSSSQEEHNNDNGHLELPSSSRRKSANSTFVRRAILTRQDMSSIQKIKFVLGLAMIVVLMSLFSNIGEQQHLSVEHNKETDNSTAETELLHALYELPLPTTQQELIELNDELAGLEPKFILQWAHHALSKVDGGGWMSHPLVQVTSFGPSGLVILDHLSKFNLLDTTPVITMDTLYLFQDSYVFYNTVRSHYKSPLHLTITKPAHIAQPPELNGDSVFKGFIHTRKEFEKVYSPTLWKTDPQYYTKVTKLDPLQQKLEEWNAVMWITGRRRSQGGERGEINVLEFDSFPPDELDQRVKSEEDDGIGNSFHSSKGRWKLNPLAYWSYDKVWKYIRDNKVPYNRLYDLGFTSIGDEMTTALPKKSNVGDVIDERSGRFIGFNRTECGLHSHLQKIKALKKHKKDSGEELAVPELLCEKCIDLNRETFMETVRSNNLQEKSLLLLEFYSPFCGSCHEFAPILNRVANYQMPNVKVARFDITEQSIPKIDNQEVFQVEATPTLYLVRYNPSFHAELYNGNHDFVEILRWLTEKGETTGSR